MYADAEARYLLTKIEYSEVPHETSLLLVDFNVGEDLKGESNKRRIERTVSCVCSVSILIIEPRLLPFSPGNTYLHVTSC
jgi:hypothetical protein